MKKLLLVLLSLGFFSLGALAPLTFAAIVPDERFGLGGGDCQTMKDLNIPWMFTWEASYGLTCKNQTGRKPLLTVGSIDVWGCSKIDLTSLEQQNLFDAEDRSLYQRLDQLLKIYEGKPIGMGGKNCPSQDMGRENFLRIVNFTTDAPGSYYEIGNESDLIMQSGDYAEIYNIFERRIRKLDPTAKVMTCGLASIMPGVSLNSSYFAYKQNDPYNWIRLFWESYQIKFGTTPKIDAWNIHPYWQGYYGPKLDWTEPQRIIVDFKNFLQTIGQQNTPIWITEFGPQVLEGYLSRGVNCNTHSCLGPTEQYEEWRIATDDLMIPLITWLKTSNIIDRWFWFYIGQSSSWGTLDIAGDMYKDPSGRWNPLATTYTDLAENSLLFNKGFEAAGIKPFHWWNWASGSGNDYTFGFDENEKHSGTRSFKIHVGQQAGQYGNVGTVFQNIDNPSLAGKVIRISVWVKTDSVGQAGLQTGVFFSDGTANTYWTPGVVTPANHPDWTYLSTGWITLPDNIVKMNVNGLATGPNGITWFDDFEMEVRGIYEPAFLLGDFNHDGKVDIFDYNLFVGYFGNTTCNNVADIDDTCTVDIFDYNLVVGSYGK